MTIIRLKWEVVDLVTLLAGGFDQQKIEWESAPSVWTELTRSHTRLPLATEVEWYLWEVPGDLADSYRVVPHRSSDSTDDTPISITDKSLRGYCTIQDLRDEGYNNPPYSDARIQVSIDRAVGVIDRVCGQRFDPYYAVVRLDVPKLYAEHHLDVPIAALWQATQDDVELTREDLVVYNRHLTQALTNPDDRRNPMVAWGDDRMVVNGIKSFSGGRFTRGRHILRLWGVWGFTELGPDDLWGETAEGNNIPLSYGSTPEEIRYACMMLASGYLATLASGGDESSLRSRLLSEKTRDQSYTLVDVSEEEASFGITGNNQVDNILMRYAAPLRVGAV